MRISWLNMKSRDCLDDSGNYDYAVFILIKQFLTFVKQKCIPNKSFRILWLCHCSLLDNFSVDIMI